MTDAATMERVEAFREAMSMPFPKMPDLFGIAERLKQGQPEAENALDDAQLALDKWQGSTRALQENLLAVIDGIKSIPVIASFIDLPGMIEQAEVTERELEKQRTDISRASKRVFRMIKLAWPGLLPRFTAIFESADNTWLQQIETIQNVRWELMAMRAEYSPSEPTGRVHGKPTDLAAYLNTLKS